MLDRQKVEAILARRFPGAPRDQAAAAANAIMGLGHEWEEVLGGDEELVPPVSADCVDTCRLAQARECGAELRLFRRRGE